MALPDNINSLEKDKFVETNQGDVAIRVEVTNLSLAHNQLTGLDQDDHPQYFNEARGDARYYTQAQVDTLIANAGGGGDSFFTDQVTHIEYSGIVRATKFESVVDSLGRSAFYGQNVAPNLTTGTENTGVGSNALASLTQGSFNVAIGRVAAFALTTGNDNVALGRSALVSCTIGGSNMAIGRNSLSGLVSGFSNVAVGTSALEKCLGGGNVAIGAFTGGEVTNGSNNTFIGHTAGQNNTGSLNVFIGAQAGLNEAGSNKLYVANTATSTPLIYGEFDNSLLEVNGDLKVKNGVFVSSQFTTTARDVLTPETGMVIFNSTTNNFQGYNGTTWVNFH